MKARERARGAVRRMDALRFVTLTMPHSSAPLAEQLRLLRSAWTRVRKARTWKDRVTGGIATLEVTRNARTGEWHPHLHALIDGDFIPHAELREAWRLALNHASGTEWVPPGERVIVDIRAITGRSGAVTYITKYATKGIDATAWGDEVIREYADATKGMRTLSTFGHLHGVTLDPRDPNEEPPESVPIINLYAIQRRRKEGCKVAEAFVVLLLHACPECEHFLHANAARAGPIPGWALDDAPGMLYRLGRRFREAAPGVPVTPPWVTG